MSMSRSRELVAAQIPLLASLAAGIGDPAVRNRGTIGGSVANNDPSADYPAAVLALGATIVTDHREIAADAFFRGLFETALEPGEIITALRFPVPSAGGYAKFKIAGVALCAGRRVSWREAPESARRRDRRRSGRVSRRRNGSRASQRFEPWTRSRRSRSTPKDLNSDIHADARIPRASRDRHGEKGRRRPPCKRLEARR